MASSIVIGEDTASVAKAIQLKEMERTVAASGSGQTTIDKSIIKQQVLIMKEQCKGGGKKKVRNWGFYLVKKNIKKMKKQKIVFRRGRYLSVYL